MNRPLFPPMVAIGILIGLGMGMFRRGDTGSLPPPPVSTAATALGDLSDLPPVMRADFDPSRDVFVPFRPPQPGYWLAKQKESGQPVLACGGQFAQQKRQPGRQRIYILPLGEFGPAAPSPEALRQ